MTESSGASRSAAHSAWASRATIGTWTRPGVSGTSAENELPSTVAGTPPTSTAARPADAFTLPEIGQRFVTSPNNFLPVQGPTLNDTGDADTGPNGLLNFPVIQSASIGGGSLTVTGWARPGALIEFFLAAADPSGFGEGLRYVGSAQVLTDVGVNLEQARAEKDYASEVALQWYVTEQVEEEANVGQIVDQLHAVGDQGGAIWYLDSKMGKRGKG